MMPPGPYGMPGYFGGPPPGEMPNGPWGGGPFGGFPGQMNGPGGQVGTPHGAGMAGPPQGGQENGTAQEKNDNNIEV